MLLLKRNLIRVGLFSILLIGSMVLLQACFPYGPEDIEEFDIVGTFYKDGVDFSAIKTYAMPDTIVHIDNSGGDPNLQTSREYDQLVLDQIAANMKALNYERIEDPETADVILTVAVTASGYNLYGDYNYSDYYGYYTPGFGAGYDYGYTGTGTTSTTYDLKTGTVLITMADLDEATDTTIPAYWIALINGVTEQSFTNTSRRLIELINRCFAQSPYLGTSASQ
jgi:hypothetical protein